MAEATNLVSISSNSPLKAQSKQDNLAIGDVVVLKSGGPLLCVRNYIPGKGKQCATVTVDWYVSDENYSATFYEEQLIMAQNLSKRSPRKNK